MRAGVFPAYLWSWGHDPIDCVDSTKLRGGLREDLFCKLLLNTGWQCSIKTAQ